MENKISQKNSTEQGINNRDYGVQYGIDTTKEYENKGKGEAGEAAGFSSDTSEMRKAPGYNGSVPGVNTPEISLPGPENKQDVSIPAFNPPVPNRAWTEMRKKLKFEMMSESEKQTLYGNRKEHF